MKTFLSCVIIGTLPFAAFSLTAFTFVLVWTIPVNKAVSHLAEAPTKSQSSNENIKEPQLNRSGQKFRTNSIRYFVFDLVYRATLWWLFILLFFFLLLTYLTPTHTAVRLSVTPACDGSKTLNSYTLLLVRHVMCGLSFFQFALEGAVKISNLSVFLEPSFFWICARGRVKNFQ